MALTLVFESQPSSTSVLELGTATFTVAGSASVPGTQITYQWQTGTGNASYANITGQTGTQLDIIPNLSDSGKWYRCVASATGASNINSNGVQLSALSDDRYYHARNGEAGTNRFLRLRSLGYL